MSLIILSGDLKLDQFSESSCVHGMAEHSNHRVSPSQHPMWNNLSLQVEYNMQTELREDFTCSDASRAMTKPVEDAFVAFGL